MAKAHEIMVDKVVTVSENDTVHTVLHAFVEYRISGIPIINAKNEPVGFISDGDVMKYIGYRDPIVYFSDFPTFSGTWVNNHSFEDKVRGLNQLNVMNIATKRVITVQFDEDVDKVAKILSNKKIKKVVVVKDKKLVGIISRGDIIRFVVKNYLGT
ncbi:MAG: HPP family protein [Syntrophomonadaceae bacterium]|jgi:CBS domain-containing protein